MKKKKGMAAVLVAVVMVLILTSCKININLKEAKNPKTDLFELSMPDELSGTYETEIDEENHSISVYNTAAKKAECGGFAFSFCAYENPADYAGGAGGIKKVGELKSADGKLYDIVMDTPTDVQYDPSDADQSEEYMKLYNYLDEAAKHIVGIEGATYGYGEGTKGADLYGEVLEKLKGGIESGWEPAKFEEEGFSVMYGIVAGGGSDALDNIGYAYYDISLDGIDDLVIGEIAEGEWKGVVYDIFTMVDRKPAHVISGHDRDRYYIAGSSVVNEYSSGALESGWRIYALDNNSSELVPQMGFKVDAYTDPDNPYFISYNLDGDEWEQVDEADFNERKSSFEEYERFDYTPISEFGIAEAMEKDVDDIISEAEELPQEVKDVMAEDDSKYTFTDSKKAGIFALFSLTSIILFIVIWYVLEVVGLWRVFNKMGEAGWKSLIPVYNQYILYKRTWTKGAFFVLLILALVGSIMMGNVRSAEDIAAFTAVNWIGLVILIIGCVMEFIQLWKMVKSFGRGVGYFILFIFFEPIMFIILGFGRDEYIGPGGSPEY